MSPALRFGTFDHLDKSGRPIPADYAERLSLVEAYDAAGFYAFHLAEHHGSPLGLAPSPSVFLAAVAARTKRLRFGPLVYTLPLYQPLRLIQEIGMLDQMSGGRLEMGVGRGIVAFETAFYGLTHLDTPPRFEEALDILKAGLSSERLTYEGKFWTYRNVPMEIPPVQRPHPPLWYGVGRPDHGAWTAARGMNIVGNGGPADLKPIFEAYRAAGGPTDAKLGFSRHLMIADDRAEAERLAAPAFDQWRASLAKLWRDNGADPVRFPRDYAEAKARGLAIAGTPEAVAETLAGQIAAAGANYMLCRFAYGNLPADAARRSVDLFVERVAPHFPGALQPA
ncbi:MAG: LLM class flavin-dependent oxidoreductase [Alphaproteobacteria bacterium]|nr:LLM class flavin-dependent oxidoreductase [Alphaproteobacteria bacterium]MCB9929377.1 LLM class flavin-dependent oxidoreductase [Alphaproteobacteria bacterium]